MLSGVINDLGKNLIASIFNQRLCMYIQYQYQVSFVKKKIEYILQHGLESVEELIVVAIKFYVMVVFEVGQIVYTLMCMTQTSDMLPLKYIWKGIE